MVNISHFILFLFLGITLVLGKSLKNETEFNQSLSSQLYFRTAHYPVEQCPTSSTKRFNCTTRPPGKYRDPHKCSNFFICDKNGTQYTVACPADGQLDPATGECAPAPAPCTPCPLPSPPPPIEPLPQFCYEPFSCAGKADGNYKDTWGCGETYYFCKDGAINTDDFIPYCQPGMYYDYEQKKCIKEEQDGVKGCFPICPGVARPTTSPPTTTTVTPPSTTPPLSCNAPFVCADKTDGFHQDPWDCTQCYSCFNGHLNGYGTYCGDKIGLQVSDPMFRSCVDLCSNEQPTTTTTEPSTTTATTTTTTPTTTTESPPITTPPYDCSVPFSCAGRENGLYQDPWDCNVCIMCHVFQIAGREPHCQARNGIQNFLRDIPCTPQCSNVPPTEAPPPTVPPSETPPTTLPSSTTTPTPPPPSYCLTPFTCADKFDPDGVYQDFWNCTMCYICTGYQITDHTTECWDTPVQSCTNICPNERPTKLASATINRPAKRGIGHLPFYMAYSSTRKINYVGIHRKFTLSTER